jgi:hypothetical protein
MSINGTEEQQGKLAAKLIWMEKKQRGQVTELRRHFRKAPQANLSTLMLGDGSMSPCRVLDLSCSGAAVLADIVPAISTPLAVGKVVGRVFRHLENGFVVQFIDVQDDRLLGSMILAK